MGKTTTTVAVAEMLAGVFLKRVLVIDLDPQTNATLMLIGEEKWEELNSSNHTLVQLFTDAIEPDRQKFNLQQALQRQVSIAFVNGSWTVKGLKYLLGKGLCFTSQIQTL